MWGVTGLLESCSFIDVGGRRPSGQGDPLVGRPQQKPGSRKTEGGKGEEWCEGERA